ncbi:MAG: glycogen/starch synthase [Prevotella sp.]|nr:glycogen/starch synthase [Prevotella sp.]MBQ9237442.1 glycogen/starch synthase [Prevotella sp.]MBR1840188.1 glycogen/starch synthase [Prevotella sp.]
MIAPDFIFESSWEVCNKVGGIYTVLSTRAKTLHDTMHDNLVFIGPDCWGEKKSPFFKQDDTILADWQTTAKEEGINVKVGRWDIPGEPVSILVDFQPYFAQKNSIYAKLWEYYKVDSLHAYGDYDEASMFSYAAGLVVESLYNFLKLQDKKVIYQANEWMTGLGALYVKHRIPAIGTIFTTHATSIGRSIAGNNKPLYDYLWAYNGDQMAEELNMQSKHSIEKQTAYNVDCFTTVSDITAKECEELIKPVDVVLPNGFEDDFVPKGAKFTAKRKTARKSLLRLANALTGCQFDDDTLIVGTSGRYEFRNKGIDVFVEAMNRLNRDKELTKQVLAVVEVPAWVGEAREDLKARLADKKAVYDTPLEIPMITHWLHNMSHDNVLGMMKYNDMWNRKEDKVKLIFIPCYLNGDDGILDMNYYDLIIGMDLSVYPSYYEPWGYTPLESIAFKVPCITTDLAGFGLWANSVKGSYSEIIDGVKTIHRTDYNYSEVADIIKDTVASYSNLTEAKVKKARTAAEKLSKKALWSEFIKYYYEAYDFALRKAAKA